MAYRTTIYRKRLATLRALALMQYRHGNIPSHF